MAGASIPGLTRGALGSVAIPAGCWLGTALGDHGDRAVSQETNTATSGMEGAPGRAEGGGGLPWSCLLTMGVSWLLCPAQDEVPLASIQPVLGCVSWGLEGGAALFPRTLWSCWGKDELWRGEMSWGKKRERNDSQGT